jgi:transposase-like protein
MIPALRVLGVVYATYVKVRQNGRIVSVVVIVAVGVNSDGRREMLGMDPSEAETFWTAFLRSVFTSSRVLRRALYPPPCHGRAGVRHGR